MKGLTHVLFGIGFVSSLLVLFQTPVILWVIGTFILATFFSRLPDYDQKVAKITFNKVVPHRGMHSHNLLYIRPIFLIPFIQNSPIIVMLITSIFGALFAHSLIDAFNSGGVWLGIFHISIGKMSWDSFLGNFAFKILGIVLLVLSGQNLI
ncbi:MAG: metal-dependent hydrolase [Candidatus Heimdallarchaeota archaeon]|nr:metal-dependent hydrolase [Candidatus Heimdallarchaeota archaeon]